MGWVQTPAQPSCGPPIGSQKWEEFSKLWQIRSVEDYQEQFEQLVSRADTLIQVPKINLYISGLANYIEIWSRVP